MKIGITMNVVTKHYDIREGIELLANLGFDSIDFPLNIYALADMPSDSIYRIMYTDAWRGFVKEVRRILDANGVDAYQTHAHWGLYTDLSAYSSPEEQYFRQIEGAAILGTQELVFHPIPPTIRMNTMEERDRVIDYNIRWFKELVPCAEANGVHICLENTFAHMENVPGDGPFPFVDGETMNLLADGIGSKCVSFCLDTGHANVQHGDAMKNMVHELSPRLQALHVHDNFGVTNPLLYSDRHMFPGYGTADLESLCVELGKTDFQGVMSLEPSHANMPKERLVKVLEAAVEMAHYYAAIVDENRPL